MMVSMLRRGRLFSLSGPIGPVLVLFLSRASRLVPGVVGHVQSKGPCCNAKAWKESRDSVLYGEVRVVPPGLPGSPRVGDGARERTGQRRRENSCQKGRKELELSHEALLRCLHWGLGHVVQLCLVSNGFLKGKPLRTSSETFQMFH